MKSGAATAIGITIASLGSIGYAAGMGTMAKILEAPWVWSLGFLSDVLIVGAIVSALVAGICGWFGTSKWVSDVLTGRD